MPPLLAHLSAFRDFDNELVYFCNFQNNIESCLPRSLLLPSLSRLSAILSRLLIPGLEKRVRSLEKQPRSLKKGFDPLRKSFDPLRKGFDPLRKPLPVLSNSHRPHNHIRYTSLASSHSFLFIRFITKSQESGLLPVFALSLISSSGLSISPSPFCIPCSFAPRNLNFS